MNPQQRYQKDLHENLISADDEQQRIVMQLHKLFDELTSSNHNLRHSNKNVIGSFLRKWFMGVDAQARTPRGIYLWGGVGRGKTYLMDLFYDCLPFEKKLRTHFHRFMQRIHRNLIELQGEKNPLELVAEQIAEETLVLCFDEFFVSDIADAMILAGLLDALFRRDVVLVTTSNISPHRLYENGLQRESFLPAIELINQNCQVLEIETGIDYRLRSLDQATLFHCPITEQTDELLLQFFYTLAPDKSEIKENEVIDILDRNLQTRYCADDVVWFEFRHLCDGPRSAFDYVEIAKLFHALLLSAVPQLDDSRSDQTRRFVALVDELYDRRVKLIISAEAPIQTLYRGDKLSLEFERTRSRLLEMQSHAYLGCEHRP